MTPEPQEFTYDHEIAALFRHQARLTRTAVALDFQVKLYENLFLMGQRTATNFNLADILNQVPVFLTRAVNFERSALFLDDRDSGVFTVRSYDGYFSDADRRKIGALKIARQEPLPTMLHQVANISYPHWAPKLLEAFAADLALTSFVAAPLVTPTKKQLGFLVAGYSDGHGHGADSLISEVQAQEYFVKAAHQASWAIYNCLQNLELAIERNLLTARVADRTAELEQAYDRIRKELIQAREFQRTILSKAPEVPGLSIEIQYIPVEEVGGDIYDITTAVNGAIRVFLADATGHGVEAALTTMFIKSAYDLVKQHGSPADVLMALNKSVVGSYGMMMFTGICLDLDLERKEIRYAIGAHPPPLLLGDGEPVELKAEGTFLGVSGEPVYELATTNLEVGVGLYLFTDGIIEQMNRHKVEFGSERLFAAIQEAHAMNCPPGPHAVSRLMDFTAGQSLDDDLTILSFRYWEPGAD